jgi:glycosyltransferase involved in cell wall biosynthesis
MLPKPLISIITATFNAAEHLPYLIASLRAQSCKDFEWIVADGASNDCTLEMLFEVNDLNLKVTSQPDFGIYDALNRGIKIASCQYYVVIGADDFFYEKTVENILRELRANQSLDLLIGQVESGDKLIKIQHGKKFIYGARAFVASHSVGCVFNRNLHFQYGYYSNKYPILADSYFIKKIFEEKKITFKYTNDIYGNFFDGGISNTNRLGAQCEFLNIQLITENFRYMQVLLFLIRITRIFMKNVKK